MITMLRNFRVSVAEDDKRLSLTADEKRPVMGVVEGKDNSGPSLLVVNNKGKLVQVPANKCTVVD